MLKPLSGWLSSCTQKHTITLQKSKDLKECLGPRRTKARTAEILLGHVGVNAVADYYDIPQLKELVNTKIQHIIEPNWPPHRFLEVVKEVFNSTTDRELREIMSLAATAHIEELLQFEDFAGLDVVSDFAIGTKIKRLLRDLAAASIYSSAIRPLRRRHSPDLSSESSFCRDESPMDSLHQQRG